MNVENCQKRPLTFRQLECSVSNVRIRQHHAPMDSSVCLVGLSEWTFAFELMQLKTDGHVSDHGLNDTATYNMCSHDAEVSYTKPKLERAPTMRPIRYFNRSLLFEYRLFDSICSDISKQRRGDYRRLAIMVDEVYCSI